MVLIILEKDGNTIQEEDMKQIEIKAFTESGWTLKSIGEQTKNFSCEEGECLNCRSWRWVDINVAGQKVCEDCW